MSEQEKCVDQKCEAVEPAQAVVEAAVAVEAAPMEAQAPLEAGALEVAAPAMNVELKALLVLAFDGIALGKDALAKNYFAVMGDVAKMITDAPSAIANLDKLQAEIAALPGSAQQADLIAFIQKQFSAQIPDEKAQSILACVLKLVQDTVVCVQDSLALVALIKA